MKWSVILLLGVLAGCENDAAKKMGGAIAPTWPELTALEDNCIKAISMGMDMEGPEAAVQAASAPQFKEALDGFENAAIPSEFANATRKTAKSELVQNLRKFSEGGTDDELKALLDKIQGNLSTLTTP